MSSTSTEKAPGLISTMKSAVSSTMHPDTMEARLRPNIYSLLTVRFHVLCIFTFFATGYCAFAWTCIYFTPSHDPDFLASLNIDSRLFLSVQVFLLWRAASSLQLPLAMRLDDLASQAHILGWVVQLCLCIVWKFNLDGVGFLTLITTSPSLQIGEVGQAIATFWQQGWLSKVMVWVLIACLALGFGILYLSVMFTGAVFLVGTVGWIFGRICVLFSLVFKTLWSFKGARGVTLGKAKKGGEGQKEASVPVCQ
jgi:hypothetical protein